jgi:DNA-3-methyladenine glycosylase
MHSILPLSFYLREDVVAISQELLGKVLVTEIDGYITSGIITETEAYKAPEDKASHAFNNKRTPRTEVFYREGGIGYVYLCYGIHSLFNVITNNENVPHGILIRSIEPIEGIAKMMERRRKTKVDKTLTSGPGALSQALGISVKYNAVSLIENVIKIEDRGINPGKIIATTRIGIDYAEEYKLMPWRFYIEGNPWVSKK